MQRLKNFSVIFVLISAVFLLCLPGNAAAKKNIPDQLNLKIKDKVLTVNSGEISQWFSEKETFTFSRNYRSEIENPYFCRGKKQVFCNLVLPIRKTAGLKRNWQLSVDENPIKIFLEDLGREHNKDPVDAKLQMEDGKVTVFAVSENGLKLDQEKSLAKIKENLTSDNLSLEIELPYQETKPEISLESLNNMGITDLIGEGRSNFRGSPKNRIFNIKVATSRFNGILIKPGEEFSFTKILGEVDGEHGYLPELVIKKDKTEPEFGGGICQVSTTTFRAAIYSGLKITARRNHAYPVQYYNPQGLDATVYVPRPDLRFINNTPAYILIQTEISGTELIFRFFGTSDGRRIEVIGPKIIQRNSDGSMKATFTQNVYDQSGNLTISDVFNSNYDSPAKYPHPGQILTIKPADWSDKQWRQYKKDNNLQ